MSVKVNKVSNMRTTADTLNHNNLAKGMLSEVDKLLHYIFHIPCNKCNCWAIIFFSSPNQNLPKEHNDIPTVQQFVPTVYL